MKTGTGMLSKTRQSIISRFLPDGTHVFVNDAYCRYFGKTRDEIIGHIFMPDIPEEDRNKTQATISNRYTRKPCRDGGTPYHHA